MHLFLAHRNDKMKLKAELMKPKKDNEIQL